MKPDSVPQPKPTGRHRLPGRQPSAENLDSLNGEERRLASMKIIWDQLRAAGVPIEERPLDGNLAWSVQFRAQAEADPTGKDMAWWKTNEKKWARL